MGEPRGTEGLFDRPESYDAMLERGLALSGESKGYFLEGRLDALRDALPPGFRPRRVLDFGCGTGDAAGRLAERDPEAEVVGTDASEAALRRARELRAGPRTRFIPLAGLSAEPPFDLCYTNGVFHHIEPDRRARALAALREALRPGGLLALFENNPWNPGTRLVMRRIPFDRDARPVSGPGMVRMLRSAAFQPLAVRYLFYFPRALSFLRPIEPLLARAPLGAQYLVLSRRG